MPDTEEEAMNSKEELLDKIEEIGTIKRNLSFRERAQTSGYGLYVQSGRLPGGAMQYMAGGRFRPSVVFIREADGTRKVKKYQPRGWELKVDETLSLCRALERASKGQTDWSKEKLEAYWAEEIVDPTLIVTEVNTAWEQHYEQLNEVWLLINPEKRDSLIKPFLNELEKEWPIEFLEIMEEKVANATMERLKKCIQMAFLVGYMVGNGWISRAASSDVNLCFGDELARDIRSVLRGAKSRGTAFASAFAAVGVEGHLAALASRE